MAVGRGVQRRTRRLSVWILLAVAIGFFATIARLNFVMHDMYHEMAVARVWVESGVFPQQEMFAFTPTVNPSVHHEWAMGLLLYGWCQSLGLGLFGLTALRVLLIAGIFTAIYATARRRGASPLLFGMTVPIVFLFAWMGFGTLRATLATLFFLAVQLRLLEEDRKGKRGWVLLMLPLWVIWINIHAGFLVGGGLFGLYFGERLISDFAGFWQRRRYGARLVPFVRKSVRRHWHLAGLSLAVAATLGLTPYGSAYPYYVFHALRMPRPDIAEWGPLWTTWWPGWTMGCYAIAVGLMLIAAARVGVRRAAGVLLVAASAYFALRHLRHGPLLAVVWCCYTPGLLQRCGWDRVIELTAARRAVLMQRLAFCVIAVSGIYTVVHGGFRTVVPVTEGSYKQRQPAGAVDYLKRHRWRGKLLTPFHAGAYVLWHAEGRVKVSLDGRYEVAYQPGVFESHRAFYNDMAAEYALPSRVGADAVLANRERPIADRLMQDEAWECVYIDDAYVLFVPANQAVQLPPEDRRGQPIEPRFL